MNVQILHQFKAKTLLVFFGLITLLWQFPLQAENNARIALPEELSLIEAIHQIGEQYQVLFNYDRSIVSDIKVQYEADASISVDEAISAVLQNTDLKYQLFNMRYVVIYKNDKEGIESLKEMIDHFQKIVDDKDKKVTAMQRTKSVSQLTTTLPDKLLQSKSLLFSLSGTVVDENGEPLIGVNIQVKGTNKGTATDFDGNFVIDDIDENAVLVVSYVGYLTREVAVAGKSNIFITLLSDSKLLDEVVVVGYGSQNRRDVSTSISSLSSEKLKDKSVSSFSRAITGQMAGVRILNSNNAPGGGTVIRIRGISSINASNDPLIVIDGFPLKAGFDHTENPLNAINTADIESIEVLKDASSSAIYGAQAANGVIIITTKKGKVGKPSINISASTGFEQMTHKMDLLNREDFLQFMADARSQSYVVEDPFYGTDNPNIQNWQWTDDDLTKIENWNDYSAYKGAMYSNHKLQRWVTVTPETLAQPYDTDWQDVTTQVGKVNNIQLSTNGGTENLKYLISGGYYNQEGIARSTGYERFSFRANVELKINKWLKTGLVLAPTLENLDVMSDLEDAFYRIVTIPPIYSPYDENGDPAYLGFTSGNWTEWNLNYYTNPLEYYKVEDTRVTARNLSTLFAEINLTKDLVFRSEFHNEFRNWNRDTYSPSNYPTSGSPTSRSYGRNYTSNRLYWNSQNFVTYNKLFGKHSVNAVVGFSAEETMYKSTYIGKLDYAATAIPTLNQAITILNSQNDARTNRSSESMIGSFARAMYNYGGKYYFTASVRRDGSSKFGSNKKWGTFPAFSAAWRVSDESFFSPLGKYINDLKIRGGWGIIGNSGIGNYNALSILTGTSYPFGSGSTVTPGYSNGSVANSVLGWETTTDYGVGVDAEILNNRVSLSVDYFYKLTEDMLFNLPLPSITGFSSYLKNIGSMRNRGFEYLVTTRNLTGDFTWTTSFNLSYYKNRVLDTGKDKRPLIVNDSYTIEGKPLAGIYGADFIGAYKDWEDVKTSPIYNADSPEWKRRSSPGTQKLTDVDGNGIINYSDFTILGSPNPDFIWGMSNTFNYKGFDLSVLINGVQGGDRLITNLELLMARANGQSNVNYDYYNNYWRPDRTDAKYAAPTRKSWDYTPNRGTLLFEGTYLSVQNISFGYTLPQSMVKRMNIDNVRFYTNVQNAFLLTKYPGFNPEVNESGDSALSQGVDDGAYPLTRIVSFGFNVGL